MADRIGVINKGEIILVEEKRELMRKLGRKELALHLQHELDAIPPELVPYRLVLSSDGRDLTYTYDSQSEHSGIAALLTDLGRAGIHLSDLSTPKAPLKTSSSAS